MAGKEPLVFIDGEYHPKSEATVSVYDHGFLYGDGVFEGIRAYNGTVFRLKEHIRRLYEGIKVTRINLQLTKEQMTNAVVDTVRRNNLTDAYIRVIISRGQGNLGLDPRSCPKPSVVIMAEPVARAHAKEAREKGITAIISGYRRDRVDGTSHELKSLNYIQSVMAKFQAIDASADEALMLDGRGMVSEFHGSNLFMIKDNRFNTPSCASGVLPGVTRARVMRLTDEHGYELKERDITPYEIMTYYKKIIHGRTADIVPDVLNYIKTCYYGDTVP